MGGAPGQGRDGGTGASHVPVVFYDACVLYPFALRNVLVWAAVDGVVRARWSAQVHEEWIRNLSSRPANPPPRARLERTRALMDAAVEGALVTGYEARIPLIDLPDPDDRHVVAAAIEGGAGIIVSEDRHLADARLARYGLRRMRAGELLLDRLARDRDGLLGSLRRARACLASGPDAEGFVERLRATGVVAAFCDALAPHRTRI